MNIYYVTAQHKLHPQSHTVVSPAGNELKIRLKTFQLLLLLVRARGEVVSKEHILGSIWDDVLVDEQVIFQSIKEIRKLFRGYDVIKTYPRKGYAWIADIEEASSPHPSGNTEAIQDNHSLEGLPKFRPGLYQRFHSILKLKNVAIYMSLLASLLVTIVAAIFIFNQTYQENSEAVISGSLVILPAQNELSDTDHKWVRYGAMDQLIQRLSSSDTLGVLQADYVIEVMKRAGMPMQNYTQEQIGQIFQVSGASFIVQMKLTGSTRDYRLIYNFYRQDGVERGAVLDNNVSAAVDQVAQIIADKLSHSPKINQSSYHSSFANEILANALELIQEDKTAEATSLLQAAIATEADNLTANRLLAGLLVEQKKYSEAQELLNQAIAKATLSTLDNELPRLRLWQAINYAQQGKVDYTNDILAQAKSEASKLKDWLLLAQIAEIKGQMHFHKKEYSQARQQYSLAMDHHKVLQCPYGQSNILIRMSQLALAEHDLAMAKNTAERSLHIIKQRELSTLEPRIGAWLAKIRAHRSTEEH